MTIAAPADKRFRRGHVKPQRKRGRQRGRWRMVRGALLVTVMSYIGYRAAVAFDRSGFFHVSKIVVRGNNRLSAGEVIALLAGVEGRDIITVDLAEARRQLVKSSWVENAAVRRVLPSTLEVAIIERRPAGISRIGDALYLVDAHGVVIDEYGPTYADIDLPIIRGLSESDRPTGRGLNGQRAALAARLLASLSRRDIAERVSEVDVSEPDNAAVILKGDPAVIRLGEDDFLERLQVYLELSSALRQKVPEIDYVDLRFQPRIYVRPVGGGGDGRRAAARTVRDARRR